ncbi:RNA-directed DNA polymerase, partial [Candidatus Woesearchaeota archaeon]|nr:RNA-directed DNA polymerase [Candidatus Woesearchaeota archaeon]
YFDSVDHEVLLCIIRERVKDERIIWLVKEILQNYDSGIIGKGMPLGNWTSQFFANVYLDKLDQFVKHNLKIKYYIRYVDDFVIVHKSKTVLEYHEKIINEFLKILSLELHPNKCKIVPLGQGVSFLGFRVFYHYKIVCRRNLRKIKAKLNSLLEDYKLCNIDTYDLLEVLQGWNAYATQ